MNEFNAEGVNNATGIALESHSEELGQPLGQPDPCIEQSNPPA